MIDEERYKIIQGDMLKVLPTFESESFDACITDPPYELGFMGKNWDKSGIAFQKETWEQVFRVLKSGAYLLAFGGSRTFHRIACAIEDAGFEIKDTIMWLYGSGFPKSMNIGLAIDKRNGVESETIGTGRCGSNRLMGGLREEEHQTSCEIKKATNEWAGWGTQLKPAYEPIIVARKPCKGTIIDNVLKYGIGGINIDECRVPFEGTPNPATNPLYRKQKGYKLPEKGKESNGTVSFTSSNNDTNELGRFPANVILTYDETDFDEVCGNMPYSSSSESKPNNDKTTSDMLVPFANHKSGHHFGDEGNACRYFYCAKASKKDRDNGLDFLESKQVGSLAGGNNDREEIDDVSQRFRTIKKNIHPTVKPVELMQYLIRLVCPKGSRILDPFNGSGSTGKAVAFENREREREYYYVGVELSEEYCEISKGRIDYAINKFEYDMIQDIRQEEQETGQMSLFDFVDDETEEN